MATSRKERINNEIKKILSDVIPGKLKDPRITGLVTVIRAEATADLKHCKAFLSIFGKDRASEQQTFEAILAAAGYIRSELSRGLTTHSTPQLHFVFDNSMEHSDKINSILLKLNLGDKDE